MSWSQIKVQAIEAARSRLVDQITSWRIARDPYLDERSAGRLQMEFQRRGAAIAEAEGTPQGITIKQLEQVHGPLDDLKPSEYKLPDGSFVEVARWDKMTKVERKALVKAAEQRKAARDGSS